MKKSFVFVVIVLSLLVSLLGVSTAVAKNRNGDPVQVMIRNHTGAPLSVVFTDAKGLYKYGFTLPVDETFISLKKGWYSYQANTRCGAVSGRINADRFKAFIFECPGQVAPHAVWFNIARSIVLPH